MERTRFVPPGIQDRLVANRCTAGQALDSRRYDRRDHLSLVTPDSPVIADLVQWTGDRFAGLPIQKSCADH